MMIDWLSCRAPLSWTTPINGGRFMSIRPDGVIDYEVDKRKVLVGSFQSHLTVRSVELGFIELSGNPAKFLQGHNLFGTDDLGGLFLATMEAVAVAVGVEPSVDDRTAWVRGDIGISRLDLTTMYELNTRDEVRMWLDAAAAGANVRWRGRGHYQPGTLTFGKAATGKRAKRWQMVLYCKGDEIAVPGHQLHPDLPERERLMDWADNKLRVELRLRTGELQRLGMQQIRQWTPEHVAKALETYLAKIELSEEQMVDMDTEASLKPRHQRALMVWRTGVDMKAAYAKPTVYRLRKELLEAAKVDIFVRCSASNVVPLRRALEAVPAKVPEWAGLLMFSPPPRLRAVA